MRTEQDIFDDLARLCVSPGYAHAIAYLCFRDNMVWYSEKEGMTAADMQPLFSCDRLTRIEISTLIGLMIKEDIDYTFPNPSMLTRYIEETEGLLKEFHDSMLVPAIRKLTQEEGREQNAEQFWTGKILREGIFYGGESPYSFHYRDLAVKKYTDDNGWLEATKGFAIGQLRDVVYAAQKIQDEKLTEIRKRYPDRWPLYLLAGHMLTTQEVAGRTGLDVGIVEKVLAAFTVPPDNKNDSFRSLGDFNVTTASPLIRCNDNSFISFQQYNLVEAMYESPFYWMLEDRGYTDIAAQNRGRFTEDFCRERLELVFGKENVHSNVHISGPKGNKPGEIDCLVIFGDRVIVLQAKSKGLTLKARKGDDDKIKEDFKRSVQAAYDQGYRDANLIAGRCKLMDSASNEIDVPDKIKEIYILCVVSGHYPALTLQAQEFLRFNATDVIQPPFVMDVFTLDVMTEMLQSPLWLLSYINRRVNYFGRIHAPNELVILSEHLSNNLWISNEDDPLLLLGNETSRHLEVAMTVRREYVPGPRTPDGFLTRFRSTTLGRIVETIEASPTPATIDLGFMLLTLNEGTVDEISKGIDKIVNLANEDRRGHLTIGIKEGSTGLIIHCNDDPMPAAAQKVEEHCILRKYDRRADSWFGMLISPTNGRPRFGVSLNFKWERSAEMDAIAPNFPESSERPLHPPQTTPDEGSD